MSVTKYEDCVLVERRRSVFQYQTIIEYCCVVVATGQCDVGVANGSRDL